MRYDLEFAIPADLYQRAITHPIKEAEVAPLASRWRNVAAAICFPASLFALNMAFFSADTLIVMLAGGCIGAGVVLAAWWMRNRTLVRAYKVRNDAGGLERTHIDASVSEASQPHIRRFVHWPFFIEIRGFSGTSLIDVATHGLIVLNAALPAGTVSDAFRGTRMRWWRA